MQKKLIAFAKHFLTFSAVISTIFSAISVLYGALIFIFLNCFNFTKIFNFTEYVSANAFSSTKIIIASAVLGILIYRDTNRSERRSNPLNSKSLLLKIIVYLIIPVTSMIFIVKFEFSPSLFVLASPFYFILAKGASLYITRITHYRDSLAFQIMLYTLINLPFFIAHTAYSDTYYLSNTKKSDFEVQIGSKSHNDLILIIKGSEDTAFFNISEKSVIITKTNSIDRMQSTTVPHAISINSYIQRLRSKFNSSLANITQQQ